MGSVYQENSTDSTQSRTTVLDERYGRASVLLNLDDALIANGILPGRTLQEKSAVVKGIIHTNAEKGNWRTVFKMLQGESPARLLYDNTPQNRSALEQLIVKGVPSKDMVDPERRNEFAEMSTRTGYGILLYKIAQREDIARIPEVVPALLRVGRDATPYNEWVTTVEKMAERYVRNKPATAHELYVLIESPEGQERAFASALKNPAKNYNFLKTHATGGDASLRVLKAILSSKNAMKKLAKYSTELYQTAKEKWNLTKLTKSELQNLESLVIKNADKYAMEREDGSPDSFPPILRKRWAIEHYKQRSQTSHEILRQQEYKGPELLESAVLTWREEHPEEDVDRNERSTHYTCVKFSKNELEQILEKVPKKNVNQRKYLARITGNKKELKRVGMLYLKRKGKVEDAYSLLAEAGIPLDDKKIAGLREKIINEEFRRVQEDRISTTPHMPYVFSNANDHQAFEMFYDKLMSGIKGRAWYIEAYDLAKSNNDEERTARAREGILTTNEPDWTVRHFRRKEDPIGVQKALELLSVKVAVPVKELEQLLAVKRQ